MDTLARQSTSSDIELHAKALLAATTARIAQNESQIESLAPPAAEQDRSLIAIPKLLLAPIRKLPPELLVQIFRYSVDTDVGQQDHWLAPYALIKAGRLELFAVLRLCAVCPAWRRLVLDTPRLWTMQLPVSKNTTNEYTALLNILLDRSFPFGIPVYIYPELSQAAVHAFLRVAPRWQTLLLTRGGMHVLDKPPTRLDLLEAVTLYDKVYKPSVFQHCPRLVAVRLHVADARHFTMQWAQVTRLSLGNCDAQSSLDIILQCDALEYLHLQLRPWEVLPPAQPPIVSLLHLRDFDVRVDFTGIAADQHSISPFFTRLGLPALKSFTISLMDSCRSSPSPLSPAFESFLQRCPVIEHLCIGASQLDGADLAAVLRHIPSLLSLKLSECFVSLDNTILQHLTYVATDPSPLVPRLQELNYETYEEGCFATHCRSDTFLAMVRSRWWTDEVLHTMPSPPRVSRLCRVNIEPPLKSFKFGTFAGFRSDDFDSAICTLRIEGFNISVA